VGAKVQLKKEKSKENFYVMLEIINPKENKLQQGAEQNK
jgi:hypothetical protein